MAIEMTLLKVWRHSVIRLKLTHPLFATVFVFAFVSLPLAAIAHQEDSIYVLCRAVINERPHDPSRDGPENFKDVNANGNSFYPPDNEGSDPNSFSKEYVWKVLNCGGQPGMYDAEPRHQWFY